MNLTDFASLPRWCVKAAFCNGRSAPSEMHLEQETQRVLVGRESARVFNPVFIRPVIPLKSRIKTFLLLPQRLAHVVFDLWVEVKAPGHIVGGAFAAGVVDVSLQIAVEKNVGATHREGHGPGRVDLPLT